MYIYIHKICIYINLYIYINKSLAKLPVKLVTQNQRVTSAHYLTLSFLFCFIIFFLEKV